MREVDALGGRCALIDKIDDPVPHPQPSAWTCGASTSRQADKFTYHGLPNRPLRAEKVWHLFQDTVNDIYWMLMEEQFVVLLPNGVIKSAPG